MTTTIEYDAEAQRLALFEGRLEDTECDRCRKRPAVDALMIAGSGTEVLHLAMHELHLRLCKEEAAMAGWLDENVPRDNGFMVRAVALCERCGPRVFKQMNRGRVWNASDWTFAYSGTHPHWGHVLVRKDQMQMVYPALRWIFEAREKETPGIRTRLDIDYLIVGSGPA